MAESASGPHLRQGDVKRKGADLLVAPLKLNVRLSKCGPRSVEPLRGLVKPRNFIVEARLRAADAPLLSPAHRGPAIALIS